MAWVSTLKNGGARFLLFNTVSIEFSIRRLVEHRFDDKLHCWASSLVGLTTVDMSKMDLT